MTMIADKIIKKDLRLSHFTLENLYEAVFWVKSDATIYQVNEMASQLTGYSKEELCQLTVHDVNPSPAVANWPEFWKRLKKEKKITLQIQHKHKTGYLYDVEITGNYIEFDGEE